MHILTGLVIAGLLKRKKEKDSARSPLLRLPGPVWTRHLLPGRARFQVPSLADDGAARDGLAAQLRRIEGVRTVDVRPVTGSVLVEHDPDTLAPELLVAAIIRILGLEAELEKTPPSILARELREMGDALNGAIYDHSGGLIDLWTGVGLALGAAGLAQLLAQGNRSLPNGLTMMWWAYTALLRGGRVPA